MQACGNGFFMDMDDTGGGNWCPWWSNPWWTRLRKFLPQNYAQDRDDDNDGIDEDNDDNDKNDPHPSNACFSMTFLRWASLIATEKQIGRFPCPPPQAPTIDNTKRMHQSSRASYHPVPPNPLQPSITPFEAYIDVCLYQPSLTMIATMPPFCNPFSGIPPLQYSV